jgi:hypothetical protein
MSMNKIANIPLETTADYQSLSKLGVQFWNQDKNTAILQFKITRNDYPLALGEENVKVFIALESGDSFLVDDKIIYVDEMEGIVSYTIPTDFMRVASNVTGQVYVTTLDEEEVVVQRQFSFKVSNDLIADLPAEDKIREIKYFADMRAEVAQMIEKLNSDFENMNDYVTQVEGTTQAGIKELNNLITQKEKAYNDNHTAKMQELDEKGTTYSQQLDDDKQYMDEKFEAFKESVNGSGLVTTGESKDWQKYKLTVDDGSYQTIDIKGELSTYQNLAPGLYYTSNAPISGMGQSSTAGWTIVEQRQNYSNLKRITFRPYNSNQEFVMRYYNEWNDWENALANVETTSGSQAKANTAESNARQYTDAKFTKRSNVLFEGNANGVGTPINLSESLDNFILLYVYVSSPAGIIPVIASPFGPNNMPIQISNVLDADGNGGVIYECILSKVNRTQLKITNDVSYDLASQTGSGANANKLTITKIVGVRNI